jgi:hypothetical protein
MFLLLAWKSDDTSSSWVCTRAGICERLQLLVVEVNFSGFQDYTGVEGPREMDGAVMTLRKSSFWSRRI